MKNKLSTSSDIILFYEECNEVRKIKQDTMFHLKCKNSKKDLLHKRKMYEQDAHCHYFVHQKTAIFVNQNLICYIRNNSYHKELKKLQKGDYYPEVILDLHGLNLYQAKRKLGELLHICYKERIFCASVIHGHGKNILKNQLPLWLSRHPNIIAFYREFKDYGSKPAILFLIDFDN